MKRDTLLIITTSYPMAGDGSEAAGSFVADFAEAMVPHMPVRVVAPGMRVAHQLDSSISTWRFAAGHRPLSTLSFAKPWHWLSIMRILLSLRSQALAAAEDGRVMHTLALWALPSGWAARLLMKKHGIPYSVWALGSDIWSVGRVPVVKRFLRRVCQDAATAFADGHQLARDAERLTGRAFKFMPTTRALAKSDIPGIRHSPPYRLLFLGRWHPNKGVDLLLEALALLGDDHWEKVAEIKICGGGPLERSVRTGVEQLASGGRPVTASGYLNKAEAQEAIEGSDYVLIPSRVESVPVVFSDAVKLGRPVIATPVGDLPQLIRGAGVLANATTPKAIAEAIGAALCLSPVDFQNDIRRAAVQFNLDEIAAELYRSMENEANREPGKNCGPGK